MSVNDYYGLEPQRIELESVRLVNERSKVRVHLFVRRRMTHSFVQVFSRFQLEPFEFGVFVHGGVVRYALAVNKSYPPRTW